MASGPSKYKGHPKSEWAAIRLAEAMLAGEKSAKEYREWVVTREAEMTAAQAAPAPVPEAPPPNAFTPMPDPIVAAMLPAEPPPAAPPTIKINSEPTAVAAPPRNLFSGQLKSLDVYGKNGSVDDPIPGYRLYWFTDVGGTGTRLRQAQISGWDFVDADEIELQDNLVPGNNDLGSHVRKVVNANQVPPTYGYLMKKTWKLDALHQAEAQIINDRMEQAMRAGTLGAAPGDGRYVAGQMPGSTLPKIEISQKSYR